MANLQRLHEIFVGNMSGGMYADLAEHLGVSPQSLINLEIGWVPIVEFSTSPNFDGWFTIPERDAKGKIVGFGLRGRDDSKSFYPGGHHGLIFVPNPDHVPGQSRYVAGAHNWRRTMEAAVPCPICHKPDGCLVSRENPTDPQAAICFRISDGSVAQTKFGSLHIRKQAGNLRGVPVLAGDGVVPIVEGMSDVAALLDLGYNPVGRPFNTGGMDILPDVIRGRRILVIGENDTKPGGKCPGKEGLLACVAACQTVALVTTGIMPPSHIKDARAWKVNFGLTAAILDEYAATNAIRDVNEKIIPDNRPSTIARMFLSDMHRSGQRFTLRQWESDWYKYDPAQAQYVIVKDPSVIQPIYQWAEDKLMTSGTPKKGGMVPLLINKRCVADLQQAMMAAVLVPASRIPCWINGVDGPDPSDLIVFKNGILNVPLFLRGGMNPLLDTSPDYFNTTALAIPFDRTAKCPVWDYYLKSSLGDDPDKIDLLQEWIGYCMTPNNAFHKMLYMRGPSASGKGVALNVLHNLVGEGQAATFDFASLSADFGLHPLVGKLIGLIWDARTPRNSDSMRGLERLLNITGGDSVSVNRKNKDQLSTYKLTARITIASNSFLDIPDHAGAMLRRLNILEFKTSFAENPDLSLSEKLKQEIPGIAVWALGGLCRLYQQGMFTVPESSRLALQEWKIRTSPTAEFILECTDPNGEVLREELYAAWVAWSRERGIFQVTKSNFYERLRSAAPHAAGDAYEKDGHRWVVFKGISLQAWAAKQLLGKIV